MISLTQVHKKAPFLPDVSYWEYGQHMTIAPLTLPDLSAPPNDAVLLMCGPPHNFAVRAFHCKPPSSGKTRKMAFYVPPAFRKALQGELLVLIGCSRKTWGSTGSSMDHHKVPVAPLDTFMRLHASNRVLMLLEYAFTLCKPGSWPFPSTMDINILLEACLAYNILAESENPPEEPASTDPETNSGTSKRHRRCKGKSKNQSKSTGATSSASEVSSGCINQTAHSDAALVSQVAQDLQLSSEGSDSDNLNEVQQNSPAIGDYQSLAG